MMTVEISEKVETRTLISLQEAISIITYIIQYGLPNLQCPPFKDGPQQNCFDVGNWNVIVVTSWPARPSCAQNQLMNVLKCCQMIFVFGESA